jgi:hypothetical protein
LKEEDQPASVPSKFVLYQEVDGAKHEVDLPLTSFLDIEKTMNELGLPAHIDLDYFPMRSAVATLCCAQKAHEIHRLFPQAYEKQISNKPISALLFGGAAVKFHCEHANGEGPLARSIKDVDMIVPKNQGSNFCKLLFSMDKAMGTQFKYFRTKGDTLFNAMRQGQRYRVRTINGVTAEGLPTVTVLDVFCDCIDLRHKVEVKESFEHGRESIFTIGLENLILSKAQFIMDLPKTNMNVLKDSGQEYRILPYQWYSSDKVVLGMEEKDCKDTCAIFLDHPIGEGPEQISKEKMRKILEKDKKLALTVTLNLSNLEKRGEFLAMWTNKSEATTISNRIAELLGHLPQVDKKWDKPWWNTAVETPLIG